MYTSTTKIRVRYAETDQMGYVYYGNYAIYFEVARVEALRQLGIHYRNLETEGVMLPVIEYKVKFLKPAYYDDELTIQTTIKELPMARIRFYYEILNPSGDKVCEAETTLVFISKKSNRPCPPPRNLVDLLSNYF